MKIQITPVQIFPNTATQIEFLPAEVTLGVSARSQYILQTEQGQNLASAWVSMTPEQYAQWASNDDYAAKCFLENLGIEPLIPIEVQLTELVAGQRGSIATFNAEIEDAKARETAANEAKALAEKAEAEAKVAQSKADAALKAAQDATAAKSLADKAASDLAIKDVKDAADALVAENARLEAARVEALRIAEQLKVDAATAYALVHPGVPKAVTMRQTRLALFNAGLLDSIDVAIAALPEPQKTKAGIEWNYSNEVDRSNGFVDTLAPTLGITSEQIDALFIAAMKL